MASVLPREINFADKLAALPANTSCTSVVVAPSNGQSFASDGALIYFDLPARGFLVPSSIYLRYKCAVAASTTAPQMKGTPFATPFSRSEVLIGSQIVESIQQYGQLYNIMVNTKLNHAQKAGMAYGLGLLDTSTTITYDNLNGRKLSATTGETWFMGAPLGNILSNCDHLLPLGMMPSVRIQLTTDALSNMFTTTSQTSLTLSNLELCFDIIDFGSDVENVVRSMADENGNIYVKSQSFVSATQTIASGTGGTIELVYNQRLSSIKTILANFGGSSTNTIYDSKDVTKSGGDYQFIIAGSPYPQRPISTVNNKAGAFMELANAWGPSHDMFSNNFAITPVEFLYYSGSSTSSGSPGKFYVACNVEKLSTNNALLTGISSQLSPISLRINFGSQTTSEVHTATLICCYDAIFEININTRQASVKQ